MYQLLPHHPESSFDSVKRLSDGVSVPMVKDNTDYQAYLKWLEEGNTPLPAEEQ